MSKRRSIYAESLYDINCKSSGNAIRLLRPLELTQGGSLVYELETFFRDDLPSYAALSYSWGTEMKTSSILVDNGNFRGAIKVTADLKEALQWIVVFVVADRPECKNWTGWLWIDQICIDQTDNLEKADQVSRMKDIYSSAHCVFVSLGREVVDHEDILAIDNEAPQRGLSYAKIRDLLHQGSRCWWNRLWVIQEISFCDHLFVCIGSICHPWNEFVPSFYTRMDRLTSILAEGDKGLPKSWLINEYPTEVAKLQVKSLHRLRARQRAQSSGEDLLDLLRSTSPSGVSNELDRVYSLLSLADEAYRKNVMVIYDVHRAVPYCAVVEHAIKRSGNLNILFDSWSLGLGHPEVPSVEAGKSKSLEPPVVEGLELPEPLPTWMPDFSQVTQGNSTNISQKGFLGATFSRPKMKVNLELELKLGAVWLGNVIKLFRNASEISGDEEQKAFQKAQMHGFHPTVCFRTSLGYCGFGSVIDTRDEIILPLGASAPFVLRLIYGVISPEALSARNTRHAPDNGLLQRKPLKSVREATTVNYEALSGWVHMLISDCYEEGFMKGELEEMIKSRQVVLEEFRIR